ncbi:MAG: calcium-translocating P-type ATPase, PMCA-type [Planctomycetes bacterium]|nr:calcium-translocating P-type ATPase, PMCA-type [Planctomycetota bacterium]
MRSLRDILQQFPGTGERGLTKAEVAGSLQRHGANRLTPLPREPLWKKFLGKFDEAIIKILLAATLLKTVVDLFESSALWGGVGLGLVVICLIGLLALRRGDWVPTSLFGIALVLVGISIGIGHPSYEGLAVMLAVVLATGVAFLSEYKSDREFEALNAQRESLSVKVIRDGEVNKLPLEEVVVGDLVTLDMGDEIPADGRLVKANELFIDQSLLTGESEPVRKKVRPEDDTAEGPEQPGCLYRGTQVVDGAGRMIITDVGDLTMIGQIARRLGTETHDEGAETSENRIQNKLTMSKQQTPLQQKLSKLAGMISKVGYVAALAIFVALLIRGIVVGEVRFSTEGPALRSTISHLLSYFVYMVIIIVVAVPEGLPMSVTVSLALAMRKMTRANSLVRQLVACETIGSATIICSDKTGTLTQNKMQIERLWVDGRVVERDQGNWPRLLETRPTDLAPLELIALNSAVNSTANLEKKEGKLTVVGNSTEGALLLWLGESGVDHSALRQEHPVLYQMHFSSERKRMTTVVERNGSALLLVKGAPEIVLEHCTYFRAEDGRIRDLDPAAREAILAALREASGKAMRTLAFASRTLEDDFPRTEDAIHERRETLEIDLVFAGFVAIRDPLRPEVKDAVRECREAGIEVMMITGDNIETARAIGTEIGLLEQPDSLVITSAEFNAMTDDEVDGKLDLIKILARARPLDKYRMVKLLQARQHVVAVTGDGTNDAPALKKADVGLAMGIAGTEVAKEASKIVLLDDSFATIVKAVHWGRALYENIQRFIQFQLTINVSALLIAFLGPFLGVKPPFTVLQLLWINVIMDTFAAIALCSEPPRDGLMKARPKRRDENIVTPGMRSTILSTSIFYVVVMLTLLVGLEEFGWFRGEGPVSKEFKEMTLRQVAIFFTVYVFFQIWNQINCRSLTSDRGGWKGLFANPVFLSIAGLTLIGQIAIISLGGAIFEVEPLGVLDWLVIAAATSSVLVFAEVMRRLRPIFVNPTR